MNPETQQRLNNWGCLLSLVALIAGGVAAFLGHPKYLLPAFPIVLFWFFYTSAQRRAERRLEREAFAEAFRGFDGSPPRLAAPSGITYGWPGFKIVFKSQQELELATSQGRVEMFKALIQGVHGHVVHHGRQFDVHMAVEVAYEEEYEIPEHKFPHLTKPKKSIWSRINYWATVVVQIGMALGTIALVFLGREFTKDELGVFAWPLTILWLASFFYVATYLVLTKTRLLVRVLWLITVTVFLLVLVAALLDGNRKPDHPSATANDGSASTQAP